MARVVGGMGKPKTDKGQEEGCPVVHNKQHLD